jgi:hypothetical protein
MTIQNMYLVESVGKRVVPAGRSAQGSPEIDDEFVSTRGGFAFGGLLQRPHQLYC